MILYIMKVKKEIRHYVLFYYLKKCREFHKIVFFQWRAKFPPKMPKSAVESMIFKNEELESFISKDKKFLY
jgi:hypothetical protein